MSAGTAAGPRRIVVMRHAQTVDNAAGVWQGHKDSGLSERGWAQVAAAAPRVAAYRPTLVVSSDLQRAVDTGEAVATLSGLTLRRDARLREVDVGGWQGLAVDDVRARFPDDMAALDRGEDVRRGATGETRVEVAARAGAALCDIGRELLPGESAVVVAHGFSGRVAASDLVGLDQQVAASTFCGLDNCHWVELVETIRSGSTATPWRIAGWNLGPWTL